MSTFEISPSLPVNALGGNAQYPDGTIVAMNSNYFPNTKIPLEGPLMWKRMIDETNNATVSIDLFIFELKPFGKYVWQWYQALLNAIKRNVKVRCVFAPACDPPPDNCTPECTKEWWSQCCSSASKCSGHTASTDSDLLHKLLQLGAEMIPFFMGAIYKELCTDFDKFYPETHVHGPKPCEDSAELHTKIFIYDEKTFYIGSANTDESAAHEFGIWITDDNLAIEITKQFQLTIDVGKAYIEKKWTMLDFVNNTLGINTTQKTLNIDTYQNPKWPKKYQTKYNSDNPYSIKLSNKTPNSSDKGSVSDCKIYFTISPMVMCSPSWIGIF